ncbi:MAG: hypothetical protein U5K43_15515 [Halofilum sp. (in: g-proteobacteria)]|nr:hypothetical protein [Halofilum sp. (in: g-proteobacteria)]
MDERPGSAVRPHRAHPDLIDTEPPPRAFLLDEVFPSNVGLLGAAGGSGKSILEIQFGVSSSRPAARFSASTCPTPAACSCFVQRTSARKSTAAFIASSSGCARPASSTPTHNLGLRDRLFIASRVGMDNRLTMHHEREVVETGTA